MPNAAIFPQNICLRGTLNINQTYTFTTSQINMDQGASIVVTGFLVALTIHNSAVYGCNETWQSITASPLSMLTLTSSTIQNADESVRSLGGSFLTLQNNTFRNNHIGLHVYGPLWTNQPVPLTGNVFQTTEGALGFAGIQLTNVPGFTIGTTNTSASPNVFDNLENGIVADRSTFAVHQASFREMLTGHGIFMENRSNLLLTNSNFQIIAVGVFGEDSSLEMFDNVMQNSPTEGFGVYTGVRLEGSNSHPSVNIHDNNIQVVDWGMIFVEMGQSSRFELRRNVVQLGDLLIDPVFSGYTGIAIYNCNFTNNPQGLVVDNTINLIDAARGIDMFDCSHLSVLENDIHFQEADVISLSNCFTISGCDNLQVTDNTMLASDIPVGGIGGLSIASTTISRYCCNTVNGTDWGVVFTGTCTGTAFLGNVFGSAGFVGLLYGDDASTGPQFDAGNLWAGDVDDYGDWAAEHQGNPDLSLFKVNPFAPPTLPPSIEASATWFFPSTGTALACNTFSNCNIAEEPPLDIADLAIAEGKFETGVSHHATLQWLAERYLLKRLTDHPELMHGQPSVQDFFDEQEGASPQLFNEIEQAIESLATVSATQTAQIRTNLGEIFERLHLVTEKDSLLWSATGTQAETLRSQREALLSEIKGLAEDNDSLGAIVSANRQPVIHQIFAVNNAITAVEIFEQNQKTVNKIWLETIAAGIYSLDSVQKSQLEPIVWQCPKTGGNAVYAARGLYRLEVDTLFQDSDVCGGGPTWRSKPASEHIENVDFQLFPNPASDETTLVVKSPDNTAGEIFITDFTGKVLRKMALPASQPTFTFSMGDLPNGIYFCKVIRNKAEVFAQKLVVSR